MNKILEKINYNIDRRPPCGHMYFRSQTPLSYGPTDCWPIKFNVGFFDKQNNISDIIRETSIAELDGQNGPDKIHGFCATYTNHLLYSNINPMFIHQFRGFYIVY